MESLPTRPFRPLDFSFTAFAGRKAIQGNLFTGWDSLVQLHDEALEVCYEKGSGPAVMVAIAADNRRRSEDIQYTTALAIDIDEGLPNLAPIRKLLTDLRSHKLTYLAQWRWAEKDGTWKVHILLPYADRYPVYNTDQVRDWQGRLTRAVLGSGLKEDSAVEKAAGLVYCMTRRPGDASTPSQEVFYGDVALDMVGMFPPSQQHQKVSNIKLTRDQVTEQASTLLAVLKEATWIEVKGAWDIRCPVDHGSDYKSKTFLYPTGNISCMAGRCQGKPLAWFISHLSEADQEKVLTAVVAPVQQELAAAVAPTVSLDEAETAMRSALQATRAIERQATMVQVSTGAGKTRAATQYLNQYSAPFEGEADTSGMTSVMAVPTNALLREVENRVQIPHRTHVGVLSVLNDDGTPACRKHEAAKKVQAAGGNVHRLMCSYCEFKQGCPARENTVVGAGSLILTNHALMTSAATSFHSKGRHPLLVWDESPQWVETATLDNRDVDWLLSEFDKEALPKRDVYEAIVDGSLFATRFRVAVRPALEVLRTLHTLPNGRYVMKDIVKKWSSTLYNRSVLGRSRAVYGLKLEGDPVAALIDSFERAGRLNTVEMGFDTMRHDTQARVLKAERVIAAIGVGLGERGLVVKSDTHVTMASLTQDAVLFRDYGGVVLDATANTTELRALRPDLNRVTLRVQDQGHVERYLVFSNGLSRTALARRPDTIDTVLRNAKTTTKRWGRAYDHDPKVAVFTYKSSLERVRQVWPEATVAYYGNTRGYDFFFQEGYDVFITLGDPVANLSSLALQWLVLGGDPQDEAGFRSYCNSSAQAELAQAHGRARNPQMHKEGQPRLHLHYGVRTPAGWDLENTQIQNLTIQETSVG